MCPRSPQLTHAPRPSWENKSREERLPLLGASSSSRGQWARGHCSRSLHSGPQGPGTGEHSQPTLCLLLPPCRPVEVSPNEWEQLVTTPQEGAALSTPCSRGQRGHVPSWGQWTMRAHLLQGPVAWQVPARDSHTQPSKARDGQRAGPPSVQAPTPRGPAKGPGDPADPASRRERPRGRVMAAEEAG